MSFPIDFPIRRRYLDNREVAEILLLEVQVQTDSPGRFVDFDFLLDTGAHSTTFSTGAALVHRIPFSRNPNCSVNVEAAFSSGTCQACPYFFSFPGLSEWIFESMAFFTPHPISRGLFCLADVLRNFEVAIGPDNPSAPWGSLRLTGLRQGHRGVRRR